MKKAKGGNNNNGVNLSQEAPFLRIKERRQRKKPN